MSFDDGARASRGRSRAALAVAALCAAATVQLFAAAAAPAAITTGPVDAASGFPFSYTDDVQAISLQQCQDASGNCVEAPRPDLASPISVPDNYTADGEGFWWLAEATVPNAGTGLARFAKESAFDNDEISLGHQVSFSRIRFRFTGLIAGTTYRITHPYGVDENVAEPDVTGGRINVTEDVGCIAPPCGEFPALAGERVTSFLRWDPSVAPDAPDGYIGNATVEHAVIGSPFLTNFVRLERLDPQPAGEPVAVLIGESDQFVVQGKLAGDPPPPAPHLGLDTTGITFGSRQVGSPSVPHSVTITNHGTLDMAMGTLALTGDAADFAIDGDGCSGTTVAPGGQCSVTLRFTPAHSGDLSGALAIPSNAPGGPHAVALTGVGTAPVVLGPPASGGGTTVITQFVPGAGAAPSVAVLGATARSLAVSRLSLARRISVDRVRSRGLRISMRLARGTQIVRVRVYHARRGRKQGRAIATAVRLPTLTGRYVITLRSRALLQALRPGAYIVEVTPSRDQGDRGRTSRIGFTITS